ncbi:type II 3-dehydroquinate dehydratase [Spongisporangium articulatum]|uniref:3-dehydroquinate dehydratase n=1 Tax=Spongisporangium articulatum TaxID=3362603 RepID=A0ABW8AIJ3_9ACTN
MPDVLLLNGPNLRLLGTRQPEIYGTTTLADVEAGVAAAVADAGWKVAAFQSDSEAELIRIIEEHYDSAGMIINPGALMMAGWPLRDALASYPRPIVEVHISNVWAREPFRHESVISAVVDGVIAGLGTDGYRLAALALLERSA